MPRKLRQLFFSKDRRIQGGYTLIEALVSFLLLIIALTPALILANSAINVANAIQNNIIAANLAQEGTEIVHAVRDTNWFNAVSFDNGLSAGDYEVTWNSIPPFDSYQGRYLLVDSHGLYSYSSGSQSHFKRKITISKPSPVELQVISQVTWQDHHQNKSLSVETHLFDWK